MSPRSEELMAGARDQFGAARVALAAGFSSNAVPLEALIDFTSE